MSAHTNSVVPQVIDSPKVWTTLITNLAYLPGLLTLDFSLKRANSKYPLVALYTDTFPPEGHAALDARRIPKLRVEYLMPAVHKDYSNDTRFYDCWSKLTPYSLAQFDRVAQLDSDMLVLQNMDELMDVELDSPSLAGTGKRVFAASHACVCNPLKKPHYPQEWIHENCAFTTQHSKPDLAQTQGAPPSAGLSMMNGGLVICRPSLEVYGLISERLSTDSAIMSYEFADQSLLSDLFKDRWVPIPYKYNALKTLRWEGVHSDIWRDDEIKNIHYILSPKPWDEEPGREADETHLWWRKVNEERIESEKVSGMEDGL
ncbi:MAG: hypothetical protein M1814_005685 [Vezdaea aestivalis]|nr:MAG: hypothetical protein M1814_005685 [Vezdaea aestivalis]